ncbi:MAG: hypothetical protein Q4D81_07610 [Eubacteriales bacterium]|nr:hypothetical protein [Eubacteriales bacterium]
MRFSVKMILDIPYSSFTRKTIRITAEDLDSLITEAIPERASREVERLKETVWKEIGWKHVNMKFAFHDIQIEFVFDQEKRDLATVYFSRESTGELLSYSSESIIYRGTDSLGLLEEEVAKRASEAKLTGLSGSKNC